MYRAKESSFNDEDETIGRKFYGPPTSCNELSMLGYTLNGFYVVEKKNQAHKETNRSKKIEVIYCQFHQPHYRNIKEGKSKYEPQ